MAENHAMPPLEYSPGKRRIRWRRIVLLAALASLVALGLFFRTPLMHCSRLLYWQRQCMRYERPSSTAVWTTHPSNPTDPDYDRLTGDEEGTLYVLNPRCWEQYKIEAGVSESQVFGHGPACPTVFLHERISPGGHRRLLRVQCVGDNALMLPNVGFASYVIEPAGLWAQPKSHSASVGDQSGKYAHAEIFFGQPDPSDASHFWIDFTVNERRGTIDGWLRDDDTVSFKLRDPATTRIVKRTGR